MSASGPEILVGVVGVVAIAGSVAVVFARDVMRLMIGLGAVFLSVAALFALFGASFLALAEIFVYVGGVLVLFLFAIMLVHRTPAEKPALESRHDILAAVIAGGTFFMLYTILSPVLRRTEIVPLSGGAGDLARALTGPQIAQFEAAGLLLLAALVAAIAILGGQRK